VKDYKGVADDCIKRLVAANERIKELEAENAKLREENERLLKSDTLYSAMAQYLDEPEIRKRTIEEAAKVAETLNGRRAALAKKIRALLEEEPGE